jgi:hypothetical protein
MTCGHANFDNGGRKALRAGMAPPFLVHYDNTRRRFLSARKLYVSTANIVNNNVYYVKRRENNAGSALQPSRHENHRYRNDLRELPVKDLGRLFGVVLDEL